MYARGLISLVLAALVLAACGTEVGGSPTAGGQHSPGPAATPAPEPTILETAVPGSCALPPDGLAELIEHVDDPLSCWGNADLTVVAQVAGVGACDGYQMDPAWFGCEGMVELLLPPDPESQAPIVLAARRSGPSLFAVLHPGSGLRPDAVAGRLVTLTGHYDDPAARTCRIVEGAFGDRPPPEDEAIALCRTTFVVISMEPWMP